MYSKYKTVIYKKICVLVCVPFYLAILEANFYKSLHCQKYVGYFSRWNCYWRRIKGYFRAWNRDRSWGHRNYTSSQQISKFACSSTGSFQNDTNKRINFETFIQILEQHAGWKLFLVKKTEVSWSLYSYQWCWRKQPKRNWHYWMDTDQTFMKTKVRGDKTQKILQKRYKIVLELK